MRWVVSVNKTAQVEPRSGRVEAPASDAFAAASAAACARADSLAAARARSTSAPAAAARCAASSADIAALELHWYGHADNARHVIQRIM